MEYFREWVRSVQWREMDPECDLNGFASKGWLLEWHPERALSAYVNVTFRTNGMSDEIEKEGILLGVKLLEWLDTVSLWACGLFNMLWTANRFHVSSIPSVCCLEWNWLKELGIEEWVWTYWRWFKGNTEKTQKDNILCHEYLVDCVLKNVLEKYVKSALC